MRFLLTILSGVLIFLLAPSIQIKWLDSNHRGSSLETDKGPILVRVSLNSEQLGHTHVNDSYHDPITRQLLGNSKSAESLNRALGDLMENYRRTQISGKMEYVREEENPQTSAISGPEDNENNEHIQRTGLDNKYRSVEKKAMKKIMNVFGNNGDDKTLKKLMKFAQTPGAETGVETISPRAKKQKPATKKYSQKQFMGLYEYIFTNDDLLEEYYEHKFLFHCSEAVLYRYTGKIVKPYELQTDAFMDLYDVIRKSDFDF